MEAYHRITQGFTFFGILVDTGQHFYVARLGFEEHNQNPKNF
jgi:hypothetical protein